MKPNSGAIPPRRLASGGTLFAGASAMDSAPSKEVANEKRGVGLPFESLLDRARAGESDPARQGEPAETRPGVRAGHGKSRATTVRGRSTPAGPRSEEPSPYAGLSDGSSVEPHRSATESMLGEDSGSMSENGGGNWERSAGGVENGRVEGVASATGTKEETGVRETAGEGEDRGDRADRGEDAMLQGVDTGVTLGAMERDGEENSLLEESGGLSGGGSLESVGEEAGEAKAGIAGWGWSGAANLTLSGSAPVAGATAAGGSFDGTWSAPQENAVAQTPTDTPNAGPRKVEGTSHSHRDSSQSGPVDPVAILGPEIWSTDVGVIRVEEMAMPSPVRELREGLMEGMLEHSANIRTTGAESLDVSIRAGGGTEISVQLSYVDGVVHAHAQCEHGDYQLLSTLWHDLQLNLSKHGVSLSSLVPPASESLSTSGSLGGGPGSGQQNGGGWGRTTAVGREEHLVGTSFTTKATASVGDWLRVQSRRLFETWA